MDALTGTEIQARDARIAGVIAETWTKNITNKISIVSSLADDVTGVEHAESTSQPMALARQLAIAAFSPSYGMQIRVEQAELIMIYGGTRVDISSDHRSLIIHSGDRRIELYTVSSPLEVIVDQNSGLTINSYRERATVNVPPNSTQVFITIDQPSRIEMNRTIRGEVRLLGEEGADYPPAKKETNISSVIEKIEVVALSIQMLIRMGDVKKANASFMTINGSQSQTRLTSSNTSVRWLFYQLRIFNHTSLFKASITSAKQTIEIAGGGQSLKLRSGNITLLIPLVDDEEEGMEGETSDFDDLSAEKDDEDFTRIGNLVHGSLNRLT